VKSQEWLLAACLLCVVVGSIALIRAAQWTAAHWVLIAVLVFMLAVVALVLWERRRVHDWREREVEAEVGQWGRVHVLREWPKKCLFCALPVYNWRDADLHTQSGTSCCAAFLDHLEDRERAGGKDIEVEVFNTPGRGWPAVLPDQAEEE